MDGVLKLQQLSDLVRFSVDLGLFPCELNSCRELRHGYWLHNFQRNKSHCVDNECNPFFALLGASRNKGP